MQKVIIIKEKLLQIRLVNVVTNAMQANIRPGFTRRVFDAAKIDFAMTNPFGPHPIYNPNFAHNCFMCDLTDGFTSFNIPALQAQAGLEILGLDDYLRLIDFYFQRDARSACAFKVVRAYERQLVWEDVPKAAIIFSSKAHMAMR